MWIAVCAAALLCLTVAFGHQSCLIDEIRGKSEKSELVLRVNATSSDHGKNASMVFDGNDNSCFSTDSTFRGAAKRHEIEIQLNKKLEILRIRVKVEPNIAYNFTVFVENPDNDKNLCHSVSTTEFNRKNGITEFSCVGGTIFTLPNRKYDKIRLSDNYNSGKFTVCEVNVVVSERRWCCETLPKPSNSQVIEKQTFDNPLLYEISCEKNYILNGPSVVRCGKDGKWDNKLPMCIANTTTMISDNPQIKIIECDPKAVMIDQKTGYVTFTSNSTKVGSKAVLNCSDGYKPAGIKVSECWPNGIWEHIGKHDFACKKINCPNRYKIPSGNIHNAQADAHLLFGSLVSVNCFSNHRNEVILRYCGRSGQWVPLELMHDKDAQSDLDTICVPKNDNATADNVPPKWYIYVIVSGVTLLVGAVITAIVVISFIVCKRNRKPPKTYRSPPSVVHSLADSGHYPPGYRYPPSQENDYNSILYEEAYNMNNFNSSGSIADNLRTMNRFQDYDYGLRSSKPDHTENIYSEPLDSKVKNIDNVIYS